VIGRAHHLQEERLFDCYLATKGGDVLDPPVVEHLTDCPDCAARYADLTQFMEMLGTEAAAEADAVFPPERLRAQRMVISRRLEHLGHQARVITFPGRSSGARFGAAAPRPARRWIAAAAAAGLIVGVGTGLFLDREGRGPNRRLAVQLGHQAVLTSPGRIELMRPDPFDSDQAFLSELELAGERPRIRELTAVDALTPHVREVNLR